MMLRTLLLTSLLVGSLLVLAPTGSASPVCLDNPKPIPDEVSICTNPTICTAVLGCIPTTPKEAIEWLGDQLGPCTCDPEPVPL